MYSKQQIKEKWIADGLYWLIEEVIDESKKEFLSDNIDEEEFKEFTDSIKRLLVPILKELMKDVSL